MPHFFRCSSINVQKYIISFKRNKKTAYEGWKISREFSGQGIHKYEMNALPGNAQNHPAQSINPSSR
jgi:hypothetical protein